MNIILSNLIVHKLLGGIKMYVEQFWRCFEQTGNIETYLDLKEYERLYKEHTNLEATQSKEQINQNSLDGMK